MSEQSLNFAKRGLRPVSKFFCLSMLAASLLVFDNHFAVVRKTKQYVSTVLYPLQLAASLPVEWYEYVSAFVQSQNYLLSENQRLTTENARLKIENRQLGAQTRDLISLKKLASLQSQGVLHGVAAEVISTGKEPQSGYLILDKGSRSNIREGDAVVDEGGLLGQISRVHPFSAEVRLLGDGKNVVPVMVARTGVRSLVHGSGDGIALRYFPTDADLQVNDVLLTSGLDSVYPPGIPVAQVMQTGRSAGTPYYHAQLKAAASLYSSKYVLVLPQQKLPEIQAGTASAAQ